MRRECTASGDGVECRRRERSRRGVAIIGQRADFLIKKPKTTTKNYQEKKNENEKTLTTTSPKARSDKPKRITTPEEYSQNSTGPAVISFDCFVYLNATSTRNKDNGDAVRGKKRNANRFKAGKCASLASLSSWEFDDDDGSGVRDTKNCQPHFAQSSDKSFVL